MKKTLLALALLALGATASAQIIPNASFETWVVDSNSGAEDPDGWETSNFGPPIPSTVTKSTDHHSGVYSAQIEQKIVISTKIPGYMGTGSATTAKPAYLNGWYKATIATGDTFLIGISFNNSTTTMGGGGAQIATSSQTSWTPFHIPLSYNSGFTPDTFEIAVLTTGPGTPIGMLDDLAFSDSAIGNQFGQDITTALSAVPSNNISASSIVPNPAVSNFTVNYELRTAAQVTLKVYDLAGKELKTVTSFNTVAGKSSIMVDAADLAAGIYFCTISAGDAASTHKLVISK